jgi:sRNA-binding carbon storage regulator CsrA
MALVIKRRRTQSIVIDLPQGKARVTVIGVDARGVLLGITAPDGVAVDREEVSDRKAAELKSQTSA